MTEAPAFLLLFVLGLNHALHIGDIVVVYTIDHRLNHRNTALLFFFTLLTHTINLVLIFLLVSFLVSLSPEHLETTITQITGAVVAAIGIFFFIKRMRERNANCTHHAHEPKSDLRSLLGAGLLGGFIPCGEVVAIGILSTSTAIFFTNLLSFLGGLILTLATLMILGSSLGRSLHLLRHSKLIRLITPLMLVAIGLYRVFAG